MDFNTRFADISLIFLNIFLSPNYSFLNLTKTIYINYEKAITSFAPIPLNPEFSN